MAASAYLRLAHAYKVISRELLVRHWIVGIRVEHDEGEGQQVWAVRCGEGVWVVSEVALCKLLHYAIYLLGFTYMQDPNVCHHRQVPQLELQELCAELSTCPTWHLHTRPRCTARASGIEFEVTGAFRISHLDANPDSGMLPSLQWCSRWPSNCVQGTGPGKDSADEQDIRSWSLDDVLSNGGKPCAWAARPSRTAEGFYM